MASDRANRIRALMAEQEVDAGAEPPVGSADFALQSIGAGQPGIQTPGLLNEAFNSVATEALASRVGLGGFKPAVDLGMRAAGAMPGPPLLKGAVGLGVGGAAGLGILGARAGIGGAVETLSGIGDEEPKALSNAGVKHASEKLDRDFKRGSYAQAVGDMIGLGLGGIGRGIGKGADLWASITKGHETAALGLGGVSRNLALKFGTKRELDATAQPAAALRAVLDSMEKTSDLTTTQRLMLRDGRFQELGDSLVKDLSDAIGPHMDVGDFGKMVVSLQKGQHDLTAKAFNRIYKEINDSSVMGTVIPGQANHWVKTAPREVAPEWMDEVTARRFDQSPMRIGEPSKYEKEVLNAYDSLTMQVKGGVSADFKSVRPKLRGIPSTGRAAETTVVDEAAAFMNLMSALPDKIPYAQLNALRVDTGNLIGKLTDARFKEQFVPQDLVGQMKQLYGKLADTQATALKAAGMGEKAEQLAQTNAAYRQFKTDWNAKLIADSRKYVEGKEPGKVYEMIADKTPAELRDYFDSARGSLLPKRFRGTWLGEGLFTRSVATDPSNGVPSLSAKKMNDFIFQNEEKIRALYPDHPDIVGKAKRLSSMIGIANSGKNRELVKQYGINIGEEGILFTRYTTAPGGVRRVEFNLNPELLTKVMESPKATDSLLKTISYPLGRVGRGALTRGAIGQYQEAQYNSALMDLERNVQAIEGVQAIREREEERRRQRAELSQPPTLGPSL